ncbi:MAG TPA: SDR family oxidoreductase [Vicinamibacterales bacterium]|nr:SDR family oxidoreductase [Vicinamibacterales bacterium]
MNNPFDFSGATAVVVGGATGLGQAMAEGLAAHGAAVCIVSRSDEKARAAAKTIADTTGGRCSSMAADLSDESSVRKLAIGLDRWFDGGLNIAINAAGVNVRNPIEKITLEEFESIQRVNITGAFLLARELFPLLKHGPWGRLINVTSIFSSRSFPLRTSYASSKGALLQLTRTLALEWAPHKITVNAISPGPILTDMTRPILDNPEVYRQFVANVPLGRFGEPHEVVPACLFLASPASSFVTGADILVDGGWTAA